MLAGEPAQIVEIGRLALDVVRDRVFRPHDEVGAAARHALVGLVELRQRGAQGVFCGVRDVGLHDRKPRPLRVARRADAECAVRQHRREPRRDDDRGDDEPAGAPEDAPTPCGVFHREVGVGQEAVDRGDEKRDAVHARHVRDLNEGGQAGLRIPEGEQVEVPGREQQPGPLEGHPDDRQGDRSRKAQSLDRPDQEGEQQPGRHEEDRQRRGNEPTKPERRLVADDEAEVADEQEVHRGNARPSRVHVQNGPRDERDVRQERERRGQRVPAKEGGAREGETHASPEHPEAEAQEEPLESRSLCPASLTSQSGNDETGCLPVRCAPGPRSPGLPACRSARRAWRRRPPARDGSPAPPLRPDR